MAYKQLSDAMSGKTPKPPSAAATIKAATGDTTVGVPGKPKAPVAPKSSVSTRDQWAKARNAGNTALAAKLWEQMKAEEAAARKR